MTAFGVLLRKELTEAWRTSRVVVVGGLFLVIGLSAPLLARFLPDILKASAGDIVSSIQFPTPTAADAVSQLQKNLGQFGGLTAIVLAMGAVATELDRGTAAFTLARPVGRGSFLAAKVVAIGLVLAGAVAAAVVAAALYTAVLFEPPDLAGWSALAVLTWLGLAAWGAITFLASTATGSAMAAAGVGVVALLGLSIVASIPAVAPWTPAGLATPAAALAAGRGVTDVVADLGRPVAASLVIIAVALAGSVIALRRREV